MFSVNSCYLFLYQLERFFFTRISLRDFLRFLLILDLFEKTFFYNFRFVLTVLLVLPVCYHMEQGI